MTITIIAFKTWNRSDSGEVVYHGTDGEKAQATGLAAFGKGFVRVGKSVNPPLIPLHPEAVLAAATDAKAPKAKKKEAKEKPAEVPAADDGDSA